MDNGKFRTALEEIRSLIDKTKLYKFEGYTPFLTTDGKTLQIEGDKMTDGARVLLGATPGAKMAAEDGTYNFEDGTAIVVKDGAIVQVTPAAVEPVVDPLAPVAEPVLPVEPVEPVVEPIVEPMVDPLAPVKVVVQVPNPMSFAEEQLQDGSMVFIEPLEGSENEWVGGRVFKTNESGTRMDEPETSGEFTLADGKVVVVTEGRISEVREAGQEEPLPAEILAGFKKLQERVNTFEAALKKKEKEVASVKAEFAKYKESSAMVTEKTLELVTELASLPAVESPRKKRGIRKTATTERKRFESALTGMRKTED